MNTVKNKNSTDDALTLKINEIFYSIQGESTFSGLPCVFVRLTYCNLRCSYCDTEYAFYEGSNYTFPEILNEIRKFDCNLVEITGGEPLIQENVLPLMKMLCDDGFEVLIETAGHLDISPIDSRVKRIMDIKCPSSGESEKNRWENISSLTINDQVKFVIGDRNDYDWAKEIISKFELSDKCTVLMSPVFGEISLNEMAEWILADRLDIRFQLQIHKYIWSPDKRGV